MMNASAGYVKDTIARSHALILYPTLSEPHQRQRSHQHLHTLGVALRPTNQPVQLTPQHRVLPRSGPRSPYPPRDDQTAPSIHLVPITPVSLGVGQTTVQPHERLITPSNLGPSTDSRLPPRSPGSPYPHRPAQSPTPRSTSRYDPTAPCGCSAYPPDAGGRLRPTRSASLALHAHSTDHRAFLDPGEHGAFRLTPMDLATADMLIPSEYMATACRLTDSG